MTSCHWYIWRVCSGGPSFRFGLAQGVEGGSEKLARSPEEGGRLNIWPHSVTELENVGDDRCNRLFAMWRSQVPIDPELNLHLPRSDPRWPLRESKEEATAPRCTQLLGKPTARGVVGGVSDFACLQTFARLVSVSASGSCPEEHSDLQGTGARARSRLGAPRRQDRLW